MPGLGLFKALGFWKKPNLTKPDLTKPENPCACAPYACAPGTYALRPSLKGEKMGSWELMAVGRAAKVSSAVALGRRARVWLQQRQGAHREGSNRAGTLPIFSL